MLCPMPPGNFLSRFDLVLPNFAEFLPDISVVAIGLAVIVGCGGLIVTLARRRPRIAPRSAVHLARSSLFPVALLDVLGAAGGAPVESSIVLRATSGALVVGLGCGLLWLASRVGRRQ